MNITVFCGANYGKDKIYREYAKELGHYIANNNHQLIFGGSNTGLMKVVADSVLECEGKIIGITPELLLNVSHPSLQRLIVTKDMAERKELLIGRGDVFIALPGGVGTLEEMAVVMSKIHLKLINRPTIFYNINGYYDDLKHMLETMIDSGFMPIEDYRYIYFANSLKSIDTILKKREQ